MLCLALNMAVSIVTTRLQKAKRLFLTHQVHTVYTELTGILLVLVINQRNVQILLL